MSCKNHTQKSEEIMSINGGGMPDENISLPAVESIVEKLKKKEELTQPDILALAILKSTKKAEIMKIAVDDGYAFSFDQLIQLNNPVEPMGFSIAHWMVAKGHKFSVEELLKLENFTGLDGETIAHWMAQNGHKFTIEELDQLLDPSDDNDITVSYIMAEKGHKFTIEELYSLGNPTRYDERTVAHEMVDHGYQFTVDELVELNRLHGDGRYVAEYIENVTYPFSKPFSEEDWEKINKRDHI
jgi:hypothetical protein